jgi:hypothetical protein
MSTRGFEFAYMLDGSNATPLIRDFRLGSNTVRHYVGDLVTMGTYGLSSGTYACAYPSQAGTTEVLGIMQEAVGSADITKGVTLGKVAIATRNQVWRCSMDAATTALYVGYTKTVDMLDRNTLDYNATTGLMVLVDKSRLDDDGTVLAYVSFNDTTFGNT